MSILTKICVVVLVVLNLVACVVFINQAMVVPKYRDLYDREKVRRTTVEQTAHAEMLVSAARLKLLRDAEAEKAQLDQEFNKARSDYEIRLGEMQTEKAKLEGKLQGQEANVARLTTVVENDLTRIKELSTDLTAARDKINQLNKNMLDLEDTLRKTEGQAERARLMAIVLQEKVALLKSEIEDLRTKPTVSVRPGEGPPPPPPPPDLTGSITAVENDIASINVGKTKGVRAEMKMMIFRGERFVGHLLVQEVDLDEAVGVVTDKNLEPMQGDKVTPERAGVPQ